jgi:biotin synthase-related radical SAM superfamily protein
MGNQQKYNFQSFFIIHRRQGDQVKVAEETHERFDRQLPERIRVSTGSAIILGLLRGKLDAKPTTIYLLTCREAKCSANCGFCPQARDSEGRADMLSRVTWPTFQTRDAVDGIERVVRGGAIRRVCVQTLNYPEVFDEVLLLVREIKSRVAVPVSVSCQPLNAEKMRELADAGVNRISVALDAATEEVFDRVKGRSVGGPYRWRRQRDALREAVRVFGEGSVSTHLIVGLGETEKDVCRTIQWCVDSGVYPALFAFTPIPGTALADNPQPSLGSYRRVQVAHHLLTHRKTRFEDMAFDRNGCLRDFGVPRERLLEVVDSGEPFLTSGCPGCNRPYYNERPGGPLYNYPRQLLPQEIEEAKRMLGF